MGQGYSPAHPFIQSPARPRNWKSHWEAPLVSGPTHHLFPMGLDKGVLTLSVLSKLPLTGKEQLTLLVIAKTHLMTDELAEPSTQKGLAPAVGSSEEKKMFVWHWEEKGDEKTEINGRILYGCISLCSIQSSSHLCSFRHCSVQFSRSVMSESLRPREPQHARPPCPSPTAGLLRYSQISSPRHNTITNLDFHPIWFQSTFNFMKNK